MITILDAMGKSRRLVGSVLLLLSSATTHGLSAQDRDSRNPHSAALSVYGSGSADLEWNGANRGELSTTGVALKATLWSSGRRESNWASGWSAGLTLKRYQIDVPALIPIPETLGSASLDISKRIFFSKEWMLMLNANPGLYSDFDSVDSGAFNMPVNALAIWSKNEAVQWGFFLGINPRGEFPVIGGVGVRWNYSEKWNLQLLMPRTGFEYVHSERTRFFFGLIMERGSYRVADDFGNAFGRPDINDEDIDFREIGVSAGVSMALSQQSKLGVDAGLLLDRRFEFDDQNLTFKGDGAPFIRLSIQGRF